MVLVLTCEYPHSSLGSLTVVMKDGEGNLITAEQVRQHSTAQDCWLIINNTVWDMTAFAPQHPGGPGSTLSPLPEAHARIDQKSGHHLLTSNSYPQVRRPRREQSVQQYPRSGPRRDGTKQRCRKTHRRTGHQYHQRHPASLGRPRDPRRPCGAFKAGRATGKKAAAEHPQHARFRRSGILTSLQKGMGILLLRRDGLRDAPRQHRLLPAHMATAAHHAGCPEHRNRDEDAWSRGVVSALRQPDGHGKICAPGRRAGDCQGGGESRCCANCTLFPPFSFSHLILLFVLWTITSVLTATM